jgi:hypothetical protein
MGLASLSQHVTWLVNSDVSGEKAMKSLGKAMKKNRVLQVGKEISFEVHVIRAGGADEVRYLTTEDVEKLEADLEAQAKTNENDQKALEKLDEQSDFFAYVFGLAMKGKGRK